MANPLEFICVYIVSMYVGIIIHEIGHAIAGLRNGYRILALGLGLGKPLLAFRIGGCTCYLARVRCGLGLTYGVHRELYSSRTQQIAFLQGGIRANSTAAIVAAASANLIAPARIDLLVFAATNLLLVWSANRRMTVAGVPLQSDGAQIASIRQDVARTATVAQIMSMQPMWDLFQGLGATAILDMNRAAAALILAESGLYEQAGKERVQIVRTPDERVPELLTYLSFLEGCTEYAMGSLSRAEALIHEAEAKFGADGNRRAAYIAKMYRARLLLKSGDLDEAAALVKVLDNDPMKADLIGATRGLDHLKLQIAVLTHGEDLKARIDRCAEGLRAHFDLDLALLLAEACLQTDEPGRAKEFVDAFVSECRQRFVALKEQEWRDAYLESLRPNLQRLTAVSITIGAPEAVLDIDTGFAEAVQAQKRAHEVASIQKRRAARAGLYAYGAALFLLVISFVIGWQAYVRIEYTREMWNQHIAWAGLAFMSVLVAVLNLILYPLWRLVVPTVPIGGWFALGTCVVPWLALLIR